ncbi:uncharacterized protein [Oscarella lobularis]|uniref:uncharacterized protein isoform X2 n=1 Tax=Oscarella lobularis TaxID=121494 RepID=UPI0033143E6D
MTESVSDRVKKVRDRMAARLFLFLSLLAVCAHAVPYCTKDYADAMDCQVRYKGKRDTCLFHRSKYYCCRKLGRNWHCWEQTLRNNLCVVFNPPQGTVFEVPASEFKKYREYRFRCNSQFELDEPKSIACINDSLEESPPKCKFVGRKETEYVNEENGCSKVVSAIRICPANTRCDNDFYEYCEMTNGIARCCNQTLKTLSTAFGSDQTYCTAKCINAPPPEPIMPPVEPTEEPEEPTTEEPKEPTEEPEEPTTEEPTTEEPKEPTEEPEEPTTEEPEEPTTEEPKEPTEEPKEPTEEPEEPTTEEPKEPTEEPEEPTTEEPEEPTTEEPKEPTEEPKEPTEEPEEPTTEEPKEPTTEEPKEPTEEPTEPETPPPPPQIICGIRLADFAHGTIEAVTRGAIQYLAFSCEPNFRLIGQSNDICFINQLGSGSNPPRCVPTWGRKMIISNGCPVTIFKEEECEHASCTGENYCKMKSDKSKECCRQRVSLGHSSFGIPDQCEEACSDLPPCQLTDRIPRYCDMFGKAFCPKSPWMAEFCKATCQC